MADYNISPVSFAADSPTAFTYCSASLSSQSCIDHILVSRSLEGAVSPARTLDSGVNLSDHLPLSVRIVVPATVPGVVDNGVTPGADVLKMRWDKCNTALYSHATLCNLLPLIDSDCLDSCSKFCQCGRLDVIDQFYFSIVQALRNSDVVAVPRKKANFYKFWWEVEATELKLLSIDAHKLWDAAGRPRSGDVFVKMRAAKAQYKQCLNRLRNSNIDVISNELNDCLLAKDYNTFWKCFKSKLGSSKSVPAHSVNGITDNTLIAESFADYFSSVCTPNSAVQNLKLCDSFVTGFEQYTGAEMDVSVDPHLLQGIISKSRLGKAPSSDGIMNEHLRYADPVISLVLSKLFKAILSHGYVPQAFGIGTVIPLLKGVNLNKSNMDNYRAITLSPAISKVFESFVLQSSEDFLFTSELQFGFKKGTGCRDAISVLYNTVQYYTSAGSTVNVACLDLSKAFDRINLFGLASKLMSRNMPRVLIQVIMDWYSKAYVSVRWNGMLSAPRRLLAGVRQGGVLSPYLFNVYVNDIIIKLELSSLGCWVAGKYVGILMYADDILIMSVTLVDLRTMLDIICEELAHLDMVVNVKKSSMIRIGPRYKADIIPVVLCGSTLARGVSVSYLGIEICAGKLFKVSLHGKRMKFFRAFNALWARTGGRASDTVILHLTRSFCLPTLLYGLEAVNLYNALLHSVQYCWSRVLFKIFKISTEHNIALVCYYVGILPPVRALDLCRLRYYCKLQQTYLDNRSANIAWHCMCAANRHSIQMLFLSYFVCLDNSDQSLVRAVWEQFNLV